MLAIAVNHTRDEQRFTITELADDYNVIALTRVQRSRSLQSSRLELSARRTAASDSRCRLVMFVRE